MLRDPGKGPPPAKRFGSWVEKGKEASALCPTSGTVFTDLPHLCEYVSLQRGSLGRGAKADACTAQRGQLSQAPSHLIL